MRVVMLCSSVYSETACATAVRLARSGNVPVGALALATLHGATLRRKVGQWGWRRSAEFARGKVFARRRPSDERVDNEHLMPWLKDSPSGDETRVFRNLKNAGTAYGFPVMTCSDQNAAPSIRVLRRWKPDVMVFVGGNILRDEVLQIPRLGVVNVHLGLLPEIRGMSSVEWSLLTGVPAGVTIHLMDGGIDTGPVLRRYKYAGAEKCASLRELRQKLIAFGVEQLGEAIAELAAGRLAADAQRETGVGTGEYNKADSQFFVMHEWLQQRAAEGLESSAKGRSAGNG